MVSVPATLNRLAAAQHALITAAQFREEGVSDKVRRAWLRRGWIERAQPRVWRLAGSPATFEQRLLAAVLASGSVASHRSAAWLWGLLDEAPVEVVVPRGRTPELVGVVVHTTMDPLPTVHRRGIPVTSPMRALVDLAAVIDRLDEIENALDRGLVSRVLSVAAVEWELTTVARRGRIGAGRLHRVLERRALASAPPDGLLEPRFARLQRRFGLRPAVFQHEVPWRGRTFRIDFAYPDQGVAIEVDGYEKRATREAFQHDTARQTALAALGWTVLRFTWHDVVRRPAYVAGTVEAVVSASGRVGVGGCP